MTTALVRRDQSTIDALLLAKLAVGATDALPSVMSKWHGDREMIDQFDAAMLGLVERGLIDLYSRPHSSRTNARLSGAGAVLAATASAQTLTGTELNASTPDLNAKAALWWWLLLNGGTHDTYGVNPVPWGEEGEVFHLLTCGLDLAQSDAVRDDTWTTFTGTFADGDRVVGVSGEATCRCGDVFGSRIEAKVESMTSLLLQVIA